jgi:hypothetical protein
MIRELIDTEVEAVVGGKGPSFDIDVSQKNFERNTATAKANKDGVATAFNVGGDQSNASLIGIG